MRTEISKYQRLYVSEPGGVNGKLREELILEYAPLVKYIAERMAMRLPPNILKEELISAGILGLYDALEKFDSDMGIKFQTYAEHRIKGAMLDELRKMDWVSRSVRKEIHCIDAATTALESKLGREPEDFEVAREMGVDLEKYHRMTHRAQCVGFLSLDDIMPDGATPKYAKQSSSSVSPYEEIKIKELKGVMAKCISTLSKKEQTVISLYYYDELTLKEIAKILELTESRISQIHSKAIMKLKVKLKSYYEDRA